MTHRWTLTDDGLLLQTDAVPFGTWDVTWPRVGVRFDLPASLLDGEASWFGTGPAESYADSSRAARVGRFSAPVRALTVDYSMPQETGHRPGLRALSVGEAAHVVGCEPALASQVFQNSAYHLQILTL